MTIHDLKERLLSRSYLLFRLKCWKNRKRQRFVKDDTEIVIEGYPRSANSLLVDSFMIAQEFRVRVANHSHHWGQVIDGVKKGLPVVITIRNPIDAAASLLVRRPEINDLTALLDYYEFHRKILPYKNRIFFIQFEDVISSPALVVKKINCRFGTVFKIPDNNIREHMMAEALRRESMVDPNMAIYKVCYPNEEKARRIGPVKERLRSHPLMPRLEDLYRQCLDE